MRSAAARGRSRPWVSQPTEQRTTATRGSRMTLILILLATFVAIFVMALVLGGLLAGVCQAARRRGIWLGKVRVPALAPPRRRGPLVRSARPPTAYGNGIVTAPRGSSRAGPRLRRSPG